MAVRQLEVSERNEAGNLTATYMQTHTQTGPHGQGSRVDVAFPKSGKSPWQKLLDVFLPAGYPQSVTDDYMEYQIYDSLQAFSSSIAGILSSRAVLSSVGVGDASASATAALLLSILQESAGRVATIVFAHRFGTSLQPECKMYRLLADVLNDIAFVSDCLSPMLPKPTRVVVLSFSSVLRALCGVAAGSAKANLSAHFARWGNLGELNAKDSSQETVISLMGMLAGSLVVSFITTPIATWTTLLALLAVHLETNRRAVRAVSMRTLNRQRATLVYHSLKRGNIPTPKSISRAERIFERDGILRDANGVGLGYCTMGSSVSQLLRGAAEPSLSSSSFRTSLLADLAAMYRDRAYILHADMKSSHLHIVLKRDASTDDQIMAWWQALEFAELMAANRNREERGLDQKRIDALTKSLDESKMMIMSHKTALIQAGWDLETAALETHSGTRIDISLNK